MTRSRLVSSRPARGFTLLEVLVAIAIFALISAMAYGALNQALRTRDRVDEERQFWHALSMTFLRMEDDLYQARARTVRDIGGSSLPPFVGQQTDARTVAAPNLEFTRGGVPVFGDGVRSDLQRVAYRLSDGVLIRQTWTALDRAPQSEPLDSPLLAGVEQFRLRFFSETRRWEDQWPPIGSTIGQPPAAAGGTLPRGVEVTLAMSGRGEITRVFLINE